MKRKTHNLLLNTYRIADIITVVVVGILQIPSLPEIKYWLSRYNYGLFVLFLTFFTVVVLLAAEYALMHKAKKRFSKVMLIILVVLMPLVLYFESLWFYRTFFYGPHWNVKCLIPTDKWFTLTPTCAMGGWTIVVFTILRICIILQIISGAIKIRIIKFSSKGRGGM